MTSTKAYQAIGQDRPVTSERVSGNIFIRDCYLKSKGDVLPFHVHSYDHTMFFKKGRAKLTIGENIERIMEAGDDLLVEKGTSHKIQALTDGVEFACVFVHRDAVGKISLEPCDSKAYW